MTPAPSPLIYCDRRLVDPLLMFARLHGWVIEYQFDPADRIHQYILTKSRRPYCVILRRGRLCRMYEQDLFADLVPIHRPEELRDRLRL